MNIANRYTRHYGDNYKLTEDMSVKEVAAHMRKVIRQAAKDGILPSEWKYSITYQCQGCYSIDVSVTVPEALIDLAESYREAMGVYPTSHSIQDWTLDWSAWEGLRAYREAHQLLESIHGSYNWDGSDRQTDYFDVRYYGHVNIHSDRY